MRKNKKYSPELKIAAVKSYLAGEGSLIQTCKKFGILRHKQLHDWIMWYNGHKDIKWCNSAKGEIYMTKGRKTTQEERAKIVAFCIEHNYDYGLTVETYGVSYNQIYAWVRKYEEGGVDKLKDNRGRTKPMEEYTRKVPASTKPNYTPALGRIYEYVEKHFKEDITINDVAQELGYSPKYISHTLALIPDSNFRKILNSRRIFNAKWWLLNSEKTVLEIALQAGYAQERTFYRAFKQETGITPCEFRKKYK